MRKIALLLLLIVGSVFVFNASVNRKTTANGSSLDACDTLSPIKNELVRPESVGMKSATLTKIDSIVKRGIALGAFPGCQVYVMKDGMTVYDKCFGNYTYETVRNVQPTTLYDLASLSKTTGTLLAIMKLFDNKQLNITDKASKYLPFLRGTDKEYITIKQLLVHESGLPGSLSLYNMIIENSPSPSFRVTGADTVQPVQLSSAKMKYKSGWTSKIPTPEYQLQVSDSFFIHQRFKQLAMQKIAHTPLNPATYRYSCVNFMLLKEIAEVVSGTTLDAFLANEFYAPMQLYGMGYLPRRMHSKEDFAPTLKKDFLRSGPLQGFVHDPDAAFMGGVSGNAGLYGTARDVAMVHQMVLNNGELHGKRYLSAETCKLFTTTTSASGRRALGYDKPVPSNPALSPCCALAPSSVFGHTGYTGTCCWVDPDNKLVYVFLSNRTYPNDGVNKLAKMSIRPKIQEVIYKSLK